MFGSQVLDVVIGLIFVYLLLSIICTAISEMIAALFSLRARNLSKAVSNLFTDTQIKDLDVLFYKHPLIQSLYCGTRKPSYIPAHFFSMALLDGIAPFTAEAATTLSNINKAVNGLPNDSELKRLLTIFIHQAGGDFAQFKTHVENWFDDTMTRSTGWYKRKLQVIVLVLAIIVTVATNADTVVIVKSLSSDAPLRASIVSMAEEYAGQSPPILLSQLKKNGKDSSSVIAGQTPSPESTSQTNTDNPKKVFDQAFSNLEQLGIPLGWKQMPPKAQWANKIIGFLLTIFAVSLGAPFWFDILNRLIKLRSAGSVPKTASLLAKEEKKD